MLDRYDIPDLLANLVERSMVVLDRDTLRYHMTESMRVYVLEQLGDGEERLRDRHLAYMLEFAEPLHQLGAGVDEQALNKQFRSELDNLRAACEWAHGNRPQEYLHLVGRMSPAWSRAFPEEDRHHLEQALKALPDADDADHIWARIHLAHVLLRAGEVETAHELLMRALEQLDVVDLPLARTHALLRLSWYSGWHRDSARTKEICQEIIQLATTHHFAEPLVVAYLHLGEAARDEGEWALAERHYLTALDLAPESGYLRIIACFNLGSTYIKLDELDRAEALFQEIYRLLHHLYGAENADATDAYSGMGYVLVKRGDYRTAGLLIGGSMARMKKAGITMDPMDQALMEEMVQLGRQQGGEAFEEALKEGAELPSAKLDELLG